MRTIGILAVATLLAIPGLAAARKTTTGPVRVKASVNKRNGSYTASHVRTKPNRTQTDNWSSKGNANPITGKKGSRTAKK